MDESLALVELERLLAKLAVEVRREALPGSGGLCRLRGKWVLFLGSSWSVAEQVEVMAGALRGFDLSGLYLRPALRQLVGAEDGADSPGPR